MEGVTSLTWNAKHGTQLSLSCHLTLWRFHRQEVSRPIVSWVHFCKSRVTPPTSSETGVIAPFQESGAEHYQTQDCTPPPVCDVCSCRFISIRICDSLPSAHTPIYSLMECPYSGAIYCATTPVCSTNVFLCNNTWEEVTYHEILSLLCWSTEHFWSVARLQVSDISDTMNQPNVNRVVWFF